jgi:hypothetical protein
VLVHDFQDLAAQGARVGASLYLPDGSLRSAQAVTASNGYATFTMTGRLDRDTYYLIIDKVELADHIWNYTAGLRSAKFKL